MDIKKHLLNALKNESILTLTGDNRVYFIHASNPKPPYIEYQVVSERGDFFEEGQEKYTKYLVQVDIFSNGNYTELERAVKTALINEGYCRDQAVDLFEEKTKLYHKAMRFNISLPY